MPPKKDESKKDDSIKSRLRNIKSRKSDKVVKESSPKLTRSRSRSAGRPQSQSRSPAQNKKAANKNVKKTPKSKASSVVHKNIEKDEEPRTTVCSGYGIDNVSSPEIERMKMEKIVAKSKVIILDIEGTTTSAKFVQEELVPYAESKYEKFIEDNWDEDVVKSAIGSIVGLQATYALMEGYNPVPLVPVKGLNETFLPKFVTHLKWLQAKQIKCPHLKTIQGIIWINGFKNKEIEGHVYDDVPQALRRWSENDKRIYIYSSASTQSQKLLFKHSCFGDLDYLIDDYFDQEYGVKTVTYSYCKILKKIRARPKDVVFFTDSLREVSAAKFAHMKAILVLRNPNEPVEVIKKLLNPDAVVRSFI